MLASSADLTRGGCELLYWNGRLHERGIEPDQTRVIRAYTQRGVAGLADLIGDWSLVLRDPRDGAIVLASDYAGTRPLYYAVADERPAWSASLAALVTQLRATEINPQYIAGFLSVGGCPNHTPFVGIRSVPPGTAVVMSGVRQTIERFWSLPVDARCVYRDERDYDAHFLQLFREAVAVRLAEPGCVVIELSGGLDSSSVACVAADLIRRGDVAASSLVAVSYVHEDSVDLPYLAEVERHIGVESIRISTSDWPMFEPGGPPAASPSTAVPMQRVAAAIARRHQARAFLTGQGGDALMGNWIDDSLQVTRWVRAGRGIRACQEALAWSRACGTPAARILARAVGAAMAPSGPWCNSIRDLGITAAEDARILGPDLRALAAAGPVGWFTQTWRQAPVERRQHFLALSMLLELRSLQPLEPIGDLPYTHPFAHRPLVEFLMSIPADVLCRPAEPRRLMRRALGGTWPAGLRTRRSKGLFTAPALRAYGPFAARINADSRWLVSERGWIDRQACASRLERFEHGLEPGGHQLRQVLLLENWLRSSLPQIERSAA